MGSLYFPLSDVPVPAVWLSHFTPVIYYSFVERRELWQALSYHSKLTRRAHVCYSGVIEDQTALLGP